MYANDNIRSVINENLKKNSDFEFIIGLKDLTLSDIDCIEELFSIKNIKSKLTYNIVDNLYIKISYSL